MPELSITSPQEAPDTVQSDESSVKSGYGFSIGARLTTLLGVERPMIFLAS
jgi:hypothetical protein